MTCVLDTSRLLAEKHAAKAESKKPAVEEHDRADAGDTPEEATPSHAPEQASGGNHCKPSFPLLMCMRLSEAIFPRLCDAAHQNEFVIINTHINQAMVNGCCKHASSQASCWVCVW